MSLKSDLRVVRKALFAIGNRYPKAKGPTSDIYALLLSIKEVKCANENCKNKFVVAYGRRQKYCSPKCSRLQRQREYWNQRGKFVRQRRKSK